MGWEVPRDGRGSKEVLEVSIEGDEGGAKEQKIMRGAKKTVWVIV